MHIEIINPDTGEEIKDITVGDEQPSVHMMDDKALIDWHEESCNWYITAIDIKTGKVLYEIYAGQERPSVHIVE